MSYLSKKKIFKNFKFSQKFVDISKFNATMHQWTCANVDFIINGKYKYKFRCLPTDNYSMVFADRNCLIQ